MSRKRLPSNHLPPHPFDNFRLPNLYPPGSQAPFASPVPDYPDDFDPSAPAPNQGGHPDPTEMQTIEALRNVLAGRITSVEVLRECAPAGHHSLAIALLHTFLRDGEEGFWQVFQRNASFQPLVA